jgi:hypothetical protein
MRARKKPVKKRKLRLDKRPLEEQVEDLDVSEEETEDIKGGFAPPYVPVLPSNRISEKIAPPNLPSAPDQSKWFQGG